MCDLLVGIKHKIVGIRKILEKDRFLAPFISLKNQNVNWIYFLKVSNALLIFSCQYSHPVKITFNFNNKQEKYIHHIVLAALYRKDRWVDRQIDFIA